MPNLKDNPHEASFLTIIVFGLVAVPLSFGLRLWARRISALEFWWDDLLMGFALIGAIAVVVDNIVGLHYGAGYHVKDITLEDLKKYVSTLFAFFLLQTITVTLIKVSLLFSYWRTFVTKQFRRAIYVVGAIILANAIENMLVFLFQCNPVSKGWNPVLRGHCINQGLFITLASLFYIATDFAIYIMPMPVIWHLQMTRRRKMEISVVFLIGGFVCLTGIARIIYTLRQDPWDATFTNANPSIWNMVESQAGFVAANLPATGPLISKVIDTAKGWRSTYGSKSLLHESRSTGNSGSTRGFERMKHGSGVGTTAAAQPGRLTAINDLEDLVPLNTVRVKTNMEPR